LISKKQTDNKGGGETLHLIEDDSLSLKDIGNYLEDDFD
jgi:hypothetical protein